MADRLLSKGELIGERFELTEPLGKGAFGAVWKAVDVDHDRTEVAVKVLFDKFQKDTKMLGRFVQEAKILEKLDHANICKPLAWQADGSDAFLAMEFIDGDTLDRKFQGNSRDASPVPLEGISWICEQLAAAIGYAHEHGIVHRDLKPKNVMVNRRGQRPFVKVLDFGIAKMLVGSELDPTTVGRVLGSVLYISPEQVLGQELTHRADVFSLGTIMFELITLRRAWARDEAGNPLAFHKAVPMGEANSHVSILRRIAREGRPEATRYREGLSPHVDEVLQKALSIKPADRFETPDALAKALRSALTQDSVEDSELPTLAADPPVVAENKPNGAASKSAVAAPTEGSTTQAGPMLPKLDTTQTMDDVAAEETEAEIAEANRQGSAALKIGAFLLVAAAIALALYFNP